MTINEKALLELEIELEALQARRPKTPEQHRALVGKIEAVKCIEGNENAASCEPLG